MGKEQERGAGAGQLKRLYAGWGMGRQRDLQHTASLFYMFLIEQR